MDIVFGYIYTQKKRPIMITLNNTPSNIANFIARCPHSARVEITDVFDMPIVSSFGHFLDRVSNMEYREELLKYLLPIQMGSVEPNDIEFYYNEIDEDDCEVDKEDFMDREEFINFIEREYNYKLVG